MMASENISSHNIFKILRMCMGLSLKDMAKKCNISAIYLSELELGKKTNPSDAIIQKIADACGINPRTIYYFIERDKAEDIDYQRYLLTSLEHLAIEAIE